jgi:hypothetical protein
MEDHMRSTSLLAAVAIAAGLGCNGQVAPAPTPAAATVPSYEQFKAGIPYHKDLGIYLVEGDVPIRGDAELRAYYDQVASNHRRQTEGQPIGAASGDHEVVASPLAVRTVNGVIDRWSDSVKRNITYCVSTGFGSRYWFTVFALRDAAAQWEASADVKFVHLSQHDGNCTELNNAVIFNVRPYSGLGGWAKAFPPSWPRQERNLLIDDTAFVVPPPYTFEGVLRHEIGHTLGFVHEENRGFNDGCFSNPNWTPLTLRDDQSVMYNPRCDGRDQDGVLTADDRRGAACHYGPAPGQPWPSCGFRGLTYRSHAANIGWLPFVWNGDISGTVGQSRRLEAISMQMSQTSGLHVCYQAKIVGIPEWAAACNGSIAGTTGQSRALEAIRITVNNVPQFGGNVCTVVYQTYMAGIGWTDAAINGGDAGLPGQGRAVEAIRVFSNCGL